MAEIRTYPLLPPRWFRAEASSHVRMFRNGELARDGRGLAFWFAPDKVSIAEIPMSDREMTFLVKTQTADYQDIAVQGTVLWAVRDPGMLSDRVDFSVDLELGLHAAEPEDHINKVIQGLVRGIAEAYIKGFGVRALLEAGLSGFQARLDAGLVEDPTMAGLGIEIVSVRLNALTPSSELARALQAPTFESLQQQADEATFARRALAVDKERAIAENELANQIELASRRSDLIDREGSNARAEATSVAKAQEIRARGEAETTVIFAEAEATRIREVEAAEAEAERVRMEAVNALGADKLFALAARELAGKLEKIDGVTVTPDMISGLLGQLGLKPGARVEQ